MGYDTNTELMHFGIKGQKWGVRRFQNKDGTLTAAGKKRKREDDYHSTGLKSAIAKRSNKKVDKGFKDWKENAQKRDDAITLGKKANAAKMAYEKDKSNKSLKTEHKQAQKDYKKALNQNTTYRKGVVRQEVGRDLSRKYLSEAKKVKKQLANDPNNKDLKKQYDSLMSKHDIERASARKAVDVSTKRMNFKANLKRNMTRTVKATATATAVAVGAYTVNRYLNDHQVTIGGRRVSLSSRDIGSVMELARKAKAFMGYMY